MRRHPAPASARLTSALLAVLASMSALAKPTDFEQIAVEVVGTGKPVLMIPGLNSAGSVWTQTCAALQASHVQCHIVQLPGFAGQPAIKTDAFMHTMRDRLLRYIDHAKLDHPIVMGHSLGGVLALEMAMEKPDAMERLVIVDSLPFFPAAGNAAATEAMTEPMAKGMRDGMLAAEPAAYQKQAEAALTNLTNSKDRLDTLKAWGKASDRTTTAQAMYEMMSVDLRDELVQVKVPTLVLGAWAGFKDYGATRESIGAIFSGQYAALKGVKIELSENGYHFLMWDDPTWLLTQVKAFIAPQPAD